MTISKRKLMALGLVLALQAAMLYGMRVNEVIPAPPQFPSIPQKMGNWEMMGEEELDQATQALLRPDVSVSRTYKNTSLNAAVSMFAGYFKTTQANAPTPHSPKICLPGAGWRGVYAKELTLPTKSQDVLSLNEYLLEKGKDKILVYYWYQNSERTWSDELMAKIYILPDLLQHKRTEVALLRVIIKVQNDNLEKAISEARDFVEVFHPAVQQAFLDRAPMGPA
jgi:EpsI family protein